MNKKLMAADLSNIEGRYSAWTVGEAWKLQAFRDYDTIIGVENGKPVRKGPDLYRLSASKMYGVKPDDIDDDVRQHGKVSELSLQYYGGVGAFATMAVTYGIDLEDMADKAWSAIPVNVISYANHRWDKEVEKLRGRKNEDGTLATPFNMAKKTYVVCMSLVTLWRNAHPATTTYWNMLDGAVRGAIATPNQPFRCRDIVIDRQGAWLRIRLQSGRYLCYPSPRVDDKGEISYAGVNAYTRQWCRIKTYSGKVLENIVQAGSRDVFKVGEARIEAAYHSNVLPVHDEDLVEVPDDPRYNVDEMCGLLTQGDAWMAGLPLAAAGREFYRYGKG